MSFLLVLFIHSNDCKMGKIIRNTDTESNSKIALKIYKRDIKLV